VSDRVIASASEAIQGNKQELDCVVAELLAMTALQGVAQHSVYSDV
jgi:hypothetical protein